MDALIEQAGTCYASRGEISSSRRNCNGLVPALSPASAGSLAQGSLAAHHKVVGAEVINSISDSVSRNLMLVEKFQ
jgi:hypothetical protein